MPTTTARDKLRTAPIVAGMAHAIIDEALVTRNTRNGKGGAAVEVWSLAFRHLTGSPDAVAPMRHLRDVMATMDPDLKGGNVDDVVAEFLATWPMADMKYDEARTRKIVLQELVRSIRSAWCYEPDRSGDTEDDAATSGQGVNIYKVRQRTANEEWHTSMVDSWCAVMAALIHKPANTIRAAVLKAMVAPGAGSQQWLADVESAFWLTMRVAS
jgi:hypothetical protein